MGPIDPPMVMLPGVSADQHRRNVRDMSARLAERVASAQRPTGLSSIRAARRAIGGYCAVFNQPSAAGDLVVAPGAFTARIASGDPIYLFLNHPGDGGVRPSLASTARGTLYLTEDRYGLWFEALIQDDAAGVEAYRHVIHEAVTGVSWGTSGGSEGVIHQGVRTATRLPIWEISLLIPPHQPRFRGTWTSPNVVARARRARALEH
jgi:HK97 family phage prohead protease